MIMDVEGRTSDERPGKGRWVVTKCNNPGNVLTFGEFGLAPAPTHQGVVMAKSIGDSGRRHVSGPESKDEKRSGKKSVEVVHALNSEDTKRVAGRYGLRKVPTAEPAVTKDRQRKGAAPSQTSEQRAEKLVSSLIAKDPSLASQFSDALKSGGVALLAAEKQLRRVQEVQQRAEFQAAAAAKQPPRRHADAANLSSITAPYETNVVGLDNNQAYRPHRRQFAPPVPHDAEVRGKRHLATPGATASVPYDNADGTVPYPAPPQCGVRTPLMQTRPGKRLLEAPTDNRDVDTVSLQRAAVRASRDTTAPTFLFGAHDGAPASAPAVKASPPRHREVGLSLLDHDFKAPVEASRKASRFAEQTHRKTALW